VNLYRNDVSDLIESLSTPPSLLLVVGLGAAGAPAPEPGNSPGFLVVAPDRGFLGNEETRDAFEAFAASRRARLVFVTDERTRAGLESASRSLLEGLAFDLGEGFAPHPLFARWAEEQVGAALAELNGRAKNRATGEKTAGVSRTAKR
jgi:hypothetical protein